RTTAEPRGRCLTPSGCQTLSCTAARRRGACARYSNTCEIDAAPPGLTSMVVLYSGAAGLRMVMRWRPGGRVSCVSGGLIPRERPSTITSPHGRTWTRTGTAACTGSTGSASSAVGSPAAASPGSSPSVCAGSTVPSAPGASGAVVAPVASEAPPAGSETPPGAAAASSTLGGCVVPATPGDAGSGFAGPGPAGVADPSGDGGASTPSAP